MMMLMRIALVLIAAGALVLAPLVLPPFVVVDPPEVEFAGAAPNATVPSLSK